MSIKEQAQLPFYFGRGLAGFLEPDELPPASGQNRYMPVRSVNHYRFVQAVRDKGAAQCYVNSGQQRICFVVRSIPEWGVVDLQIESIQKRPQWTINQALWKLIWLLAKTLRLVLKFGSKFWDGHHH